jgi:hypothetical protein
MFSRKKRQVYVQSLPILSIYKSIWHSNTVSGLSLHHDVIERLDKIVSFGSKDYKAATFDSERSSPTKATAWRCAELDHGTLNSSPYEVCLPVPRDKFHLRPIRERISQLNSDPSTPPCSAQTDQSHSRPNPDSILSPKRLKMRYANFDSEPLDPMTLKQWSVCVSQLAVASVSTPQIGV